MVLAIGTLIALVSTVLGFIFSYVGFFKYPRQWRKFLPVYIYVLFMIGFCIESSRVTDMTRYFAQIEELKYMSLSEAVEWQGDSLYVKDFFFWLSARLDMPHLMTGAPVALVMGVMAYIACDYAHDKDMYKYLAPVLLLMLARSTLSNLANNIRNVSAFAVAVLAVYREVKQKKRNLLTLILYILPIFIHANGIILIVVRLLVPLVKRHRILTLALVFTLPAIIEFAYANVNSLPFSGSVGTIIRRLVYSAHNYLAGESAYSQSQAASTNALIKRLIGMSRLAFTTAIIYMEMREEKPLSGFKAYTYILAILALSCNTFNAPAYWRFSTALSIANIPMYINILSGKTTIKRVPYGLKLGLLAYSIISIMLRIDTTLDDVNIAYFAQEMVLTNGFTLFGQAVSIIL